VSEYAHSDSCLLRVHMAKMPGGSVPWDLPWIVLWVSQESVHQGGAEPVRPSVRTRDEGMISELSVRQHPDFPGGEEWS
jgi:hypothetical protein